MKGLFTFYTAILIIIFGIVLIIGWILLPIHSSQEIIEDGSSGQVGIKPNQTQKEIISEKDEGNCLNVEYPKRKNKHIVSFGVLNVRAIDIPKPDYPEAAKATNISGEVSVSVGVDEKGNVIWGRIETGHPLLQTEVQKVVCQARFKPKTLSGKPVSINGIIVYKFILS